MKPDLVFVYGTLKRGFGNHHVMERAGGEFVGEATTIKPFPLVVNSLPYLLNRPGEGLQVEGEIYRVDPAGWKLLDRLEGHPQFYRRRVESFLMDSLSVDAWTYFLVRPGVRLSKIEPVASYPGTSSAVA